MSDYFREYYNDDHENKDHMECGIKYIDHKLERPVRQFISDELNGTITYDPDTTIFLINGQFPFAPNQKIKYWAANPINRIYSYSGSALPFPNPEVAYENTPNQGYQRLDNQGRFIIKLEHPSGYYVRQGKLLLNPHVHLKLENYDGPNVIYNLTIADHFPYRSLKNLPDRPNRSTNR
jgi:uncharacterized protein YlzI (FlbEa/FlbD family)